MLPAHSPRPGPPALRYESGSVPPPVVPPPSPLGRTARQPTTYHFINMTTNTRQLLVALAVLLAASGLAATAIAAPPSVDTSTTDDTTSTSELTPGYVYSNFTANDSKAETLQYVADSNNSKVSVMVPVNGINQTVYTNSTPATVNWNSTSATGNFNVTINRSQLADVPGQINSNRTGYVKIWNDTTAASPNTTAFKVYFNFTDERSVYYVSDDRAANDSDISIVDSGGYSVPFTETTFWDNGGHSQVAIEDRKVNGSETDVVVVLANDTVASDYEDSLGAADTGSWVINSVAMLNGDGIKSSAAEPAESLGTDDTSLVYESDVGGQPALVVDVGDDYDDEDSVDVTSYSGLDGEGIVGSFTLKYDAYGLSAATGAATLLSIGSAAFLFVVGRPEQPSPETESAQVADQEA